MFPRSRLIAVLVLGVGALVGYAAATGRLNPFAAQPEKKAAEEKGPKPGDPAYSTPIDGKYLPNPAPTFGGTINLNAVDSKPYWSPTVVPPKGAPNVLLIMTDDVGFGAPSAFGGVIPTPNLERIGDA